MVLSLLYYTDPSFHPRLCMSALVQESRIISWMYFAVPESLTWSIQYYAEYCASGNYTLISLTEATK